MTRYAKVSNRPSEKLAHKASTWSELTKGVKKDVSKRAQVDVNHVESTSQDPTEVARELAIKKDKRREHRRVKRMRKREMSKVCFHCRKPGHGMADCPIKIKQEADQEAKRCLMKICYKCGSDQHDSRICTVRVQPGTLPYARCHICEEMGHLARECPENPNYVGRTCQLCGSVEHLKRDCPDRDVKDEVRVYKNDPNRAVHVSVDEELALYEDIDEKKEEMKKKKNQKKPKKKVIFF